MSPDPVGENANAWLRRKNKVRVQVGSSTFAFARDEFPARVEVEEVHRPVPSPEEAAAIGGADGHAGRDQEQQSRGFDINAAIREGSALRKLKKQGRL